MGASSPNNIADDFTPALISNGWSAKAYCVSYIRTSVILARNKWKKVKSIAALLDKYAIGMPQLKVKARWSCGRKVSRFIKG